MEIWLTTAFLSLSFLYKASTNLKSKLAHYLNHWKWTCVLYNLNSGVFRSETPILTTRSQIDFTSSMEVVFNLYRIGFECRMLFSFANDCNDYFQAQMSWFRPHLPNSDFWLVDPYFQFFDWVVQLLNHFDSSFSFFLVNGVNTEKQNQQGQIIQRSIQWVKRSFPRVHPTWYKFGLRSYYPLEYYWKW